MPSQYDKHQEIKDVFQQIGKMGIWDEKTMPMTIEEYSKLISEEDESNLLEILNKEEMDTYLTKLTIIDLMKFPFDRALRITKQFTLAKRIALLEELNKHRSFLYSQASKYDAENLPKEEGLTPREWSIVMGRIKHLEILMSWLYGIL